MLVMLIRFIDMGNFILTLKSILPWTGMLEYIKWRKWGDHKHLFLSLLKLTHISIYTLPCGSAFLLWHVHLASPCISLLHLCFLFPCPQVPSNLFLPSYWPLTFY